jgi:phosphatidylserine decarboxylase
VRIPLTKYGVRELLLFGGLASAGIAASAAIGWWYLAPVFVLALVFVLSFFRDPSRRIPEEPGVVVAPADGKIVEVTQVDEPPLLKVPSHKIAIFMSPLNVHVNRAPCGGEVETIEYRPGRHHNAQDQEASSENEAVAMIIRAADGRARVLVRQVAGVLARRIVCAAAAGERVERGQRFGMIKFGSRAEVYVPVEAGFEVRARLGQRVRAGETVLGRFT